MDEALDSLARRAAEMGYNDDSEEEEEDDGGTGVMTSQLRHFVIQVRLTHPKVTSYLTRIQGLYAATNSLRHRARSE